MTVAGVEILELPAIGFGELNASYSFAIMNNSLTALKIEHKLDHNSACRCIISKTPAELYFA